MPRLDDHRLAIAEGGTINVIDFDTGTKIVEDIVSDLPALSIAFDKGSDRLAVANGSAADIWDLDGKRAHRLDPPLPKHNSLVLSIAYDPSGRQLVTASQDGTARIWDAETGAPRKILSGHAKAVFAALFSADGQRVVTGSFDGTLRVWNAGTGKQVREPIVIGHPVLALSATNDDGEFVVTSLEEPSPSRLFRTRAAVWNVRIGREVWPTSRNAGSSEDEAIVQKRASRLIKASSDGDLLVMDGRLDGRQDVLAMLPSNRNKLVGLAGGASRDLLYTLFEDGSVRAWQLVPSDPYGLVGYARKIAEETLPADQQSLTPDEQRDLGIWQGPVWLNVGVLMRDALMRWAHGTRAGFNPPARDSETAPRGAPHPRFALPLPPGEEVFLPHPRCAPRPLPIG